MFESEDMMRKISGLIAKAEGTDNENEAAAFFDKAQELMLRYAIDEQRVREAMGNGHKVEECVREEFMFATHDAHAKGKVRLLYAVAKSQHVMFLVFDNRPYSNVYREGNEGKYSQWGVLLGYKADIERVKFLYASLLIQWARFVRQDVQTQFVAKRQEYGFRTGHLVGFAARLRQRFLDLEARVLDETNGSALMVNKDAEVDDFYRKVYGLDRLPVYCLKYDTRKNASCGLLQGHEGEHKFTVKTRASRSRGVNSAGYYAGQTAADRADIGQVQLKNGSHQIKA